MCRFVRIIRGGLASSLQFLTVPVTVFGYTASKTNGKKKRHYLTGMKGMNGITAKDFFVKAERKAKGIFNRDGQDERDKGRNILIGFIPFIPFIPVKLCLCL
jgi:hypothetical protein